MLFLLLKEPFSCVAYNSETPFRLIANHYQTKRYGERSTVLVLTKADAATYTCSLEGESETRELRLKSE